MEPKTVASLNKYTTVLPLITRWNTNRELRGATISACSTILKVGVKMKFTIRKRKLGSEELRELKARNSAFQGLVCLATYSCLNLLAIHNILRGVAILEAVLLIFCATILWFLYTLAYVIGYVFSRGLRSRLLANLFITSGVISLAVGGALLITFSLTLASLPNVLIHQLETGALGFWGFLLGILGFLLLAVLEKAGLAYLFIAAPIFTGVVLVLMGAKRRPALEVH